MYCTNISNKYRSLASLVRFDTCRAFSIGLRANSTIFMKMNVVTLVSVVIVKF